MLMTELLLQQQMGQEKGKGKNKKVMCYKCKKQGHYANKYNEGVHDEDNNTTKKTSNKKGSNFMNHGQFKKLEKDYAEGDTTDEDAESLTMNTDSRSYSMMSTYRKLAASAKPAEIDLILLVSFDAECAL